MDPLATQVPRKSPQRKNKQEVLGRTAWLQNCRRSSPAQLFLFQSPAGLMTILLSHVSGSRAMSLEELIAYFLWYDTDRIDNNASNCWNRCFRCGPPRSYINRTTSGFQELGEGDTQTSWHTQAHTHTARWSHKLFFIISKYVKYSKQTALAVFQII
jgi:hypothetical protein